MWEWAGIHTSGREKPGDGWGVVEINSTPRYSEV
jgi:hypothetical protein